MLDGAPWSRPMSRVEQVPAFKEKVRLAAWRLFLPHAHRHKIGSAGSHQSQSAGYSNAIAH